MKFLVSSISAAALLVTPALVAPAMAQSSTQSQVSAGQQVSDADLVDLADYADLVVRAKVRKQSEVAAERAPGLRPGYSRFYIEADTQSLIAGSTRLGERIRYLVDLPLDARGKKPKLKKQDVILFARPVPDRPGELLLVAPDAQLLWNDALEQRTRLILKQLVAPDAAPRIAGVRDALSVAGTLAGESETQIFLDTVDDSPARDGTCVGGVFLRDRRPGGEGAAARFAGILPPRLRAAAFLAKRGKPGPRSGRSSACQ